jgi:GT2 family glycosyltransferase
LPNGVANGFAPEQTQTRPLPETGAIAVANAATPDVAAVILNYGAPHEVLHRCVASLVAQTYPTHILLVDNGSPRHQEAVDLVGDAFPDVQILRLDKNYGFAGGMNRGVAAVSTEYVLLLNNDVTVAPDAVEEMRRLIDGRQDVVGIAPKILLENPPGFIDAIGNLVDSQGQAFNMGIGQLDAGQYDSVEETFGACFAAALLRRDAWREGLVGTLDESYFMYYEDVDWCFRAGILGYKFLTCPSAVVHHTHSMSTRQLAYGYKYRLIMRNFVRTVLKDFEGKRAYRVATKRVLGLVRNVLRGPYRWASLLAVKDVVLGFPVYIRRRRPIQGRRRVQDQRLFGFSHGEQGFFDPTAYAPLRRLEALAFIYNRKFLLHGDDQHRRIAEAASALAVSRLRFDHDFLQERLGPLVSGEPACVQEFVESIEA